LAELRVLRDEALVDRLGLRQVDRGRPVRHARAGLAALVAGRHRRLVAPHLVQVDRLGLLPVQLRQLVERLRLLLRVPAVAQVVLDEPDGLLARGGDLLLLLVDGLEDGGRELLFFGGGVGGGGGLGRGLGGVSYGRAQNRRQETGKRQQATGNETGSETDE